MALSAEVPGLAQLASRFSEQASLGGAPPLAMEGSLGKAGADLLSSAEATTAYSSSESSSAADQLTSLDGGMLESFGQSGISRQSDGARSSGMQEGKAQICFDFTKGVCSRGDKCKYSHDLATIVHFNSKEKGICFDYLRNQCHRGLLCRFSHDLSNIAQQCQAYSNGAKENKGAKPNAICYDFVKGVCQRGVDCRYSHDLSLIARMARGGAAQPKAGEVCYDYLRGRCNRGATCKYSHNISFLAAPGFLGSALSNEGAPLAAQAQGAVLNGATPPLGPMMSGPLAGAPGFMGMGAIPGMPPRLATTLSADHATLLAAASQNAAAAHMFAMQQPPMDTPFEGRRRTGSMSGADNGNDTLNVNDQPSAAWAPGMSAGTKSIATAMAQQAAMLQNIAAHQRMAQAAVAANLQAFNSVPAMHGLHGMHSAGGAPPGAGGGMPESMMGSNGGAMPGVPLGRPPLPPSGQLPPELAALLAGGVVPDNPLLAETLAAAAKAQSARMLASSGGSGSMLPSMGSSGGMGPTMPQAIPGRDMSQQGYDVGTAGPFQRSSGGSAQQGNGGSGGGAAEILSRSAPTGGPGSANPVNVNPDLLPMIKEIWQKS